MPYTIFLLLFVGASVILLYDDDDDDDDESLELVVLRGVTFKYETV